jgi:tetrahydromethanopterin S-methyltransferase subunit F
VITSRNGKYLYILILLVALALPSFVSAMTVTVGIPEKYSEVTAGEKVYFETEVKWPENVGRKDLRVEYSVKYKDGNEVAYLKVLKAIETQASFMDSISIPASTKPGMYRIEMKLGDYKDLDQNVAASFKVAKGGNNTQTILFIITGLLSVVIIFVTIELFVLMRRHNNT